MLKLIYYTGVFGPIDFEYDRPVIHVGRNDGNDLVLRHPSVEPYHCRLLFRDETVLWLPPGRDVLSPSEMRNLTGPEFGPEQPLRIGEIEFRLAHSPRSIALPVVPISDSMAGVPEGAAASGGTEEAGQRRYYCANCRTFIQEADVKRIGLQGHAKRELCPKCSRLVEAEIEPEKPPMGLAGRLRSILDVGQRKR